MQEKRAEHDIPVIAKGEKVEAAVLRKIFGREVKRERHRFRIIKECV